MQLPLALSRRVEASDRQAHSFFLFFLFAATFKQVAKTVTDVNLRDNVVDVVYKMFDENGKATNITCLLIRIVAWMKWMSG